MGIQGLLPFLKKIHKQVNVAEFQGCTVAIDAYCWLHKGAFSCADKLALGEKTEQYVYYCMKYVDYLLRNGLKPILVFDGCHLPSKKDVETSRRERRELNRKKAAQLLREGKRAEARECLQRCIDISPQMALELMNACRARGVDCIVAPYEADAQLAYLNRTGIAQIIITEDSDLLLFGCDKVIFKMDLFGNGVLIEQSRLNEVMEIQDSFYTFEKFRYMCILSGCDYLPSLPGIGLGKACKVFKLARQTDIRQLLKKLPTYLKMNIVVTNDYIEGFIRADNTFLYQLAFDPLTRKLCPLTLYPAEIDLEEVRYAGPYFSDERALQIALGNVDIHTHQRIADFDPETYVPKYAKKTTNEMRHMLSIWKHGYRPRSNVDQAEKSLDNENEMSSRPSLAGKEVQVRNNLPKRSPKKCAKQVEESADVKTNTELADLYSAPRTKRRRMNSEENCGTSPEVKAKNVNPFDTDEDSDDQKTSRRESSSKKHVLSPSKSANQLQEVKVLSTNEAFFLMEQESGVAVSPEEKENGKKSTTAKRNRFAVSALVKRSKFSLDAPALPNVKIEVKSRYFNSSSSTAAPSTSSAHEKTPTNNTAAEEVVSTEKCPTTFSPNRGLKRTSSESMEDGATVQQSSSVEKKQMSSSPGQPQGATSLLSKFSHSSAPGKPLSSKSKDTKQSGSASKGSQAMKSSQPSPGSAFNWSSFKFTKSSSSPNFSSSLPVSASSSKPFKRVMSDSNTSETSDSLKNIDSLSEHGDQSQNDPLGLSKDSDKNSALTDSMPKDSQEDQAEELSQVSCSQQSCSIANADASQRSNLYSIDSDCFPTSQDFVDLTDCETDRDSQSLTSGGDGDFASPASASQGSLKLKSPKSTPRTTSTTATKKCRVSGLSRGKKKTSPGGGDEKQQKIRDMFSRFAHQK